MFEIPNHAAGKRVMAMLLVLAMMFAMLGDYAPTWFAAVAEEVNEEDSGHSESSGSEDDSSGSHESSHEDSGSSGERESSHEDSSLSGEHESSHEDGGSSGEHESSHEDRGSSEERESSHEDGGSSEERESSHEDGGSSEERESSHEDSDSSETRESASPGETVVWGEVSGDGSAGSEDEHDDAASGDGEVTSDNDSSDNIESALPEVTVIWGEASGDEHAGSENEQNDVFAENVEVTSEDESTSGDSGVSEVNEDRAADDSIPVVVWGSFGDGDAAGEMETGTEPSGKPVPAEAEGEPTEAGTEDSAPVEAAVKEVEVLIGETDPAEAEVEPTEVGADDSAPVEAAVKEVEALIGETGPVYVEAAEPGDGAETGNPGAVLTLAAALSPAVENSEPVEDEVLESEPLFTTQAYTAPVMLAATGAEEEKICVLQRKINDAMQAAGDTLSGRIRVVLEKNTTYDGEVTIDNGGRQVADDFELEVSSVDAGSDGMQADGTTIFTGSMTIRGISVKIAGVGLPGTVTVDSAKAKLDYYGTRADDGANVTVTGEGAEAALHTGEGADAVNVQAQNGGAATVDAGTGADTVTAAVSGSGSAVIETGEGEDNVSVSVTGEDSTALVNTGAGADTVQATTTDGSTLSVMTGDDSDAVRASISDSSQAIIATGAGDDTVNAHVSGDSQAELYTGAGDDIIGITGVGGADHMPETASEDAFVQVHAEAGDDTVLVTGKGGESYASGDDPRGTIDIDLGSGENEADVDLSIADIARTVSIKGGDSRDRLHVTGELKPIDDDDYRDINASGNASAIDLVGVNNTLHIASSGMDTVTDDLQNKRKVEIGGDGALLVALPFTNYIYRGLSENQGKEILFTGTPNLLMTNVVIAPDDSNTIIVNKDTTITAHGLQLVLHGRTVQVDGTLQAGLVRVEATDGTDRNTLVRLNHGKIPLTNIDLGGTYSLELLNITDVARVTIGKSAHIFSESDIVVTSNVEQKGGIINVGDLTEMNLVDLKVARATVDVNGSLYAGYDALNPGRGSVYISARAKTATGYDEDGNPVNGLPVALALANMDSLVHIASEEEYSYPAHYLCI